MIVLKNLFSFEDFVFEQNTLRMPTKGIEQDNTRVANRPNQFEINKRNQSILKNCPKEIDKKIWLSLTPERRQEILRNKKNIEDRLAKGEPVIDPNQLEKTWTPEQRHEFLAWSALATSFLGPWGMAASTVLTLIDASLYFKEGQKEMGWLFVFLTALPALRWFRLGFLGKSTLGSKGLIELWKKISFRGGRFILKSGSKLNLGEKRFLLAVTKNFNVVLKTVMDKYGPRRNVAYDMIMTKRQLSARKFSKGGIALVASQFILSIVGFGLIDPEMSAEEQKEAKNTIESTKNQFVKDKNGGYTWSGQQQQPLVKTY